HSHTIEDNKGKTFNLKRLFYRSFMKYLIKRNTTHFFGCTKEAHESLHGTKIPKKKVEILKNGINLNNKSKVYKNEKNNKQKEINIPNYAVVIVHIGRFSPFKNHTFILDVFKALLEKKNDNYYLLLIGEGKLLPDIKEKAKEM